MAIQTKTIVIKVNDKYFLQSSSPSVTVGINFFLPSNLSRIYGLYALPNYPVINTTGSTTVFDNLILSLVGLPNNPKLVSLFNRIDATLVVDLMIKANLRTGFVSENLLNYYYIDVKINKSAALISIIKKLKSLPGVDFVYVRGDLANFEPSTEATTPLIGVPGIITDFKEKAIGFEEKRVSVENLLIPPLSFLKKSEITPLAENNVANISSKELIGEFSEIKVEGSVNQAEKVPAENLPPTLPPSRDLVINDKIKSLFSYCRLSPEDIDLDKKITVIDFERGWNFVQNDNSLYPNLANNGVYGGGYNHPSPSHKFHGQKTLNILFGKQTSSNQIDGLCKGAIPKIASAWFGKGINDKQPEPALVKTLVDSGIVEGDVVLLEVQCDRWLPNLPIEIESAMYAVIKAGVQAGYIIIEASGNGKLNGGINGGYNLNNVNNLIHSTSQTNSIVTTENPPVNFSQNSLGSGAIMVGGRKADSSVDTGLNYGNRVDYYCFAEPSFTSSNSAAKTVSFNLTSLASAITAALVARLQSQAMNTVTTGGINRRLTISEIKTLLRSIPYPTPTSVPIDFRQFLINNQISMVSTISATISNP